MTDREIRKAVMKRFPLTEKEKEGCKQEIQRMSEIRELYKQRLINEYSGDSQAERSPTEEV